MKVDNDKGILFGVYPWAFDCPGGGERQLLAYKSHLEYRGQPVSLYNQWNPCIKDYNLFHFFSVMPGSFQLCNHIKQQGVALVVSPNLWVTPETKYHYPHDAIKELLDIADCIVVNSQIEKKSLSKVYEISEAMFSVVHNGVEGDFFISEGGEFFERECNIGAKPYVLNVANIEPRKNQLSLIHALKSYPELSLVVIGHIRDAAYAKECFSLAGDQLKFVGPLSYNSRLIRSAMAGCNFFAMPSTLETPSIAALEAAAMGAKIMITKVGSATEYFEKEAVYITPDSIDSIRKGIGDIQNRSCNREGIDRMNEHYRWSSIVKQLESTYKSVLSS